VLIPINVPLSDEEIEDALAMLDTELMAGLHDEDIGAEPLNVHAPWETNRWPWEFGEDA
jgi:hypothetical protein